MSEVKYSEDRPKDCRYCYFWSGKKKGCDLGGEENCYYRIRPEELPLQAGAKVREPVHEENPEGLEGKEMTAVLMDAERRWR